MSSSCEVLIIKMIIEDYYGFQGGNQQASDFRRDRALQRVDTPQRGAATDRKNMFTRAMKRTELSKEKLQSRDSRRQKRLVPPKLLKQEPHKEEASAGRMTLYEQEQSSANRQEIENMVKKYDGYKNADSFEFKGTEINRPNRSSYVPEPQTRELGRRPDSRSGKQQSNRRRVQREPSQQESNRNYHSFSRGKNQEFLVHFQREVPIPPNAIERMAFNKTSATDLRMKKSKSMSAKLKPYKMHTFYNVDKRNFYNYNEEGYMTDRQYQLLNKIETKAKEAYDRAKAEEENERHEKRDSARKPREKKFDIEENSKIQHKNSGILSVLKHEYQQTPKDSSLSMSIKRVAEKDIYKLKKDEKLQLSGQSKKQKNKMHDDYQMVGMGSGSKPDVYAETRQPQKKPQTKNMFQNFAGEKDDDSLLEFKPSKPKDKQPREDWVKRSSEISNDILSINDNNDYKSIDMMEINSNCKPTEREIKQKFQFIKEDTKDDNRSLGMDTLKSHPIKKIEAPLSGKKSNQSHSNSPSSSSRNQSQSSSQIDSETNGKESKKESTPSSKHELAANNINFSKKKVKHSQSLSENFTESEMGDLNVRKTIPQSQKEHADIASKTHNQLYDSDRLRSSKDSASIDSKVIEPQTKKIKIKKLTRKSQKDSEFPSEKLSADSGYESLGMQSITYEKPRDVSDLMKINLKPINEKNSKFQNEVESYHQSHDSHLKVRDSVLKSKQKSMSSQMKQRSQPSIAYRSKVRSSNNNNNSSLQYDLFGEIRDFLEEEECDYNQVRKAKEIKEQISEELDYLLESIEDHLYIINCIAEIILLVPDVYDFQTIYDKEKEWIFYQIFLTLKKYIYERNRVVTALRGGKNCFTLLNYIIQDNLLKKYLKRSEVVGILTDMEECNIKLDHLIKNFYNFLIKFNKNYASSPHINLKPFKNEEQLTNLLMEYDQQIDTLLKKKEQEFGQDGPIDDEEAEMMFLVNERIFRLMEMGFVMSNLAGKEIKSYEKDEELFRDEKSFRNYIFENHLQFKQMIKYFK